MATNFTPQQEIEMLCRFCKKVHPASLERSIAGNGRTIDRESTFEYCCSKCTKTFCYYGVDLLENKEENSEETENRTYNSKEEYFIGETIFHSKFKEAGKIVGKDIGSPKRIIVQFEKSGIRRLVEGV